MRIRPYKTVENKIEGAVLALFDIDHAKQAEQRVQLASEYAEAVLDATTQPFAMLDSDLRIRSANRAFGRMFDVSVGELDGRHLDQIGDGTWDLSPLRASLGSPDGAPVTIDPLTVRYTPPNAPPRLVSIFGRALPPLDSANSGLLMLGLGDATAPQVTR
jgi:two-component system CheB/CheR fusion protein